MTKRALWKGVVLAESDKTVVVENHHYVPVESLHKENFRSSDHHTVCAWKGTASYYDVLVGDEVNANAAWYYPEPKEAAKEIKDHVAFWRGVEVV